MAEVPTPYRGTRLDLPRGPRRLAPRVDPDAFARFSERIARYLGTGRFLAVQTVIVLVWITLNLLAVSLCVSPRRTTASPVSAFTLLSSSLDCDGVRNLAIDPLRPPSGSAISHASPAAPDAFASFSTRSKNDRG